MNSKFSFELFFVQRIEISNYDFWNICAFVLYYFMLLHSVTFCCALSRSVALC